MTGNDRLARFGFCFKRGGAHTARTMMLAELEEVLAYVDDPDAGKSEYRQAVVDENCLGKRSAKTRAITYNHLVELYGLDPSFLLFRSLLFFWKRDIAGRPLLALLCTYARDGVFRSSAPQVLQSAEGTTIARETMEAFIDDLEPGRFSAATLKSVAQNINATWTRSGHLTGRAKKVRTRAVPTSGAISYALLLAYLTGHRGASLFQSEYIALLECSFENALELAEDASRKGWIVFKRVGDVMEVLFPALITKQEMEWIREQN